MLVGKQVSLGRVLWIIYAWWFSRLFLVLTWTVVARFSHSWAETRLLQTDGLYERISYFWGSYAQLDSAWHRFLSCQCDRRDTPHIAANAGTLIPCLPKFWLRRAACLQLSNNLTDSVFAWVLRVIRLSVMPATLVCCNFFRSGCGLVVANVSVIFLSKVCHPISPPLQPGDQGCGQNHWWQQ